MRTEVTEGHGSGHLEALSLYDKQADRAERVPAAALFVLIGGEPCTQWLPETVQLEDGYILTGRDVVPDSSDPAWWPRAVCLSRSRRRFPVSSR